MPIELRDSVINMKTLSQYIDDPIVVNSADARGRALRIIFTQEAAAQLADNTKVYLSWQHQQLKTKGYNVFTRIDKEEDGLPPTWEIRYPPSLLHYGDVLACIELVDEISIAASTNFMIHVLIDPNDGESFVATDDFSEFKAAVVALATIGDTMEDRMEEYETEFENMRQEHQLVIQTVSDLSDDVAETVALVAQIQEEVNGSLDTFENTLASIMPRLEQVEKNTRDWAPNIEQAKQEAITAAQQYTDEHSPVLEWGTI